MFTCIGCDERGKINYARAIKTSEGDCEFDLKYKLIRWPEIESHICTPSNTQCLVKKFMNMMYNEVKYDSNKPIPQIYNDVRSALAEKLSPEDKDMFYEELPSYKNVQSGLYQYRKKFHPKDPGPPYFN